MSAKGHEQTSRHVRVMSVIPLKADIRKRGLQVRLVPLAHISTQFYRRPYEVCNISLQYGLPQCSTLFQVIWFAKPIKYLAGTTGKMSATCRKRRDGRIDLSSIREPIGFGGG
jgi:hypothetical protein